MITYLILKISKIYDVTISHRRNRVFRNPLEVGLEKNVLSERCYQLLNAVLAKNPPPQMTDKV